MDISRPHLGGHPGASRQLAIGVVLLAVAFLFYVMPFAYGHGFERKTLALVLYNIADREEDWAHCLFVPAISLFLVYLRREYLSHIPIRGSVWGLGLVIFSLALYWLGYKAETQYIGFGAIQLLIAGVVIWFLGWQFFRALLFPWIFLAFAWPLVFMEGWVALPLRLVMSEVSYLFLNVIGLDTVQRGTAILSAPDAARGLAAGEYFSVDIADPCSGIRSLFALLMICALYGYVAMPRAWQHVVIFLSAIPLAILGNFVRILALTFGILAFGSEFAIGPDEDNPSTFHMAAGYAAVYGVAVVGMVLIGKLLRKIDPGPPPVEDEYYNRKPAPKSS
ncbi:MAG: exosortase/archaeosortase family protein [Verrucomicrobiota bacterium]